MQNDTKKRWLIAGSMIILLMLTLTVVGVTQISAFREQETVPQTIIIDESSSHDYDGSRPRKRSQEMMFIDKFLTWDLINGLFLVIIVVEFFVFPFLFWLWFSKSKNNSVRKM